MPDRVFTEEEVKEIVRRASEQQAEDAERRQAREHGLTLDDLERLGAEVGLDPAYLRRAADEVKTGRRAAAETDTKTDTHVVVERRIDRPFTPEAWEDTVVMLRQSFGVSQGMWFGGSGEGRVEQVGRAHEWVHVSGLGVETRVSASDRDGQTRLILSQRVGQASPKVEGRVIGGIVGAVLGAIGGIPIAAALDSFWIYLVALIAITLVTMVVTAPLITRLDERWRDKKQRGLKDLAADIEQVFKEATPVAQSAPQAEAPAPAAVESARVRLDLDALPDEEGGAGATERNRTRS